jgi:hypothetical protein
MTKNKIILMLLLLTVAGFLFYWYEYRPSAIRKDCHKIAIELAKRAMKDKADLKPLSLRDAEEKGFYFKDDYEYAYKECLRSKGLEK